MQTILNQILESNFDYENRYLDFSCTKIDISLNKNRIYEGSFHVYGPEGAYTHGSVFSSDRRMEILTKRFNGSSEEIYYRFRGEEMEEGEVLRGSIFVVSSQGEYTIPFTVSREAAAFDTSSGSIKNLSHFATLARNNWREAVNLFYSGDFKRLLTDSEKQYFDTYKALSEYRGSETNVEEFLIAANKKSRNEFLIQENQMTLSLDREATLVTEHEITVIRNGWGYSKLTISVLGDFLFTEKEMIGEEDFLGNTCKLPFFIDRDKCHYGENFGKIILSNPFTYLEIPIKVNVKGAAIRRAAAAGEKLALVNLMSFYKEFRAKRMEAEDYIKESSRIAERLMAQDDKNIGARLFRAQLLIMEDKTEEAGWLLDQAADSLQNGSVDETLLAYYYYLTSLIHREPDYVNRVTAEVEHIYRKDNENWRVAWLLLFLSEEYHKSATAKWVFLEKQFTIGCTSPLLYIEAVTLLNSNPALLRRLGEFEQQVVWYGVKQDMFSDDCLEQLLYLTEKVKEYSFPLFRSLNRLYESKKDPRMLQQVCTLLIKGGRVGEEYFRWYRDGVEQNLHITNLYEYFMMSIDLDKDREIPKRVLMYFSYQNNMDYEHTAYMYDYILKNEAELHEIYASYKGKIEHFCLEQVLRGHLSRSLANIYNRFLQPGMLNEETSQTLAKILFGNLLTVGDRTIRKVYVYTPDKLYPEVYSIHDGKTWMPLYGSDYTIVLEDAWGNRYVKSVDYTVERIMLPGRYQQQLEKFQPDNLALDLYFLGLRREESLGGAIDAQRALRVAASEGVDEKYRHKLMLKLLLYYYEKDAYAALDEYLSSVPIERMTPRERGEVMQFMILRDKYDMAANCLAEYGPGYVDTKLLVRLLDGILDKNGMTESSAVTAAALYAFRKGRYDSTVLYYLCRYYKGTTREARDIWKAAKTYQLDCQRICELMLVQMLYTGAFIQEKLEVFRNYVQSHGDPDVEGAFLAHCATEYYLYDRSGENVVFDEIHHMHVNGSPLLRICQLAFLKYYALNYAELTESAEETANDFLDELLKQGIHLEFFRAFRNNYQMEQEMADKVIFEYRGKPGSRFCVHYCTIMDGMEPGEVCSEYLREVCSGIFYKEFVLFYGETVEYYITQDGVVNEEDGTDQILESGTLNKDIPEAGAGRYRLINDVVICQVQRDYTRMDSLLEKYYKREYLNAKLFTLK